MNEEIRSNEIREEELENINGGMVFTILPGFGSTEREQRNKDVKKNSMELNDDMPKSIDCGDLLPAMLNPFTSPNE